MSRRLGESFHEKFPMISWHIPLKSSRTCWCSSESRWFFFGEKICVGTPTYTPKIITYYKPIPKPWPLGALTKDAYMCWPSPTFPLLKKPRLKKIMRKRSRLRLVVASATLDAGAFLSGWPSWLFQTGNALCRLETLEINQLRRRCWHVNPRCLFFIFFIRKVAIRWFQILV